MVLVVKDRIKDTSTTSGTGTITLANSPPAGYQAFSTLGNGSTTYYTIQDANDAFEIGLGTYNANTLTRTTVLSSSNSGNLVSLTSGPNTVWVDYPAAKAYLSEEGIDKSFTATASITAGKPVILNSAGTVTQVSGNLDNNYLGVASTSAGANETVNINIPGSINNDQTSLTVGEYYYTSSSGVISTTLSPNFIGRAISSTQLLLEEEAGNSMVGFSNGAITKGKPVVMQADGDVAQVAQASGTENYTFSKGSATALVAADTDVQLTSCFDISAQRFILVYTNEDASNYVYGNLVEVDSSNVVTSRGIETIISSSYGGQVPSIAYDSANEKSMLVYHRGAFSGDLGCRVLTATGTSLSVGAEVVINDNDNTGTSQKVVYEPTSGKLVVSYKDQSNSSYITAQVGTISGTTSSWGSNTLISAAGTATQLGLGAGNGKVLFLTTDDSNNADARAGTISGTTFTLGSPVEFDADNASNPYPQSDCIVCYDTQNDRFFAGYEGTGDNLYGMVFQISGTTVSHGTRSLILYNGQDFSVPHFSDIGKIPLIYGVYSSNSLYYREATITSSNNSIAYNTPVALSTDNTDMTTLAYDSTSVRLLAAYHLSNDNIEAYGIVPNGSRTGLVPNLTTENYLGIASDTVANNKNVLIDTQGAANPDQSSLTPAQLYYVQTDGTLSTTAGSPSVVAGIATSATTLLITRS